MERIGSRVRTRRKAQKMTVRELARRIGKTARFVHMVEAGDRGVSFDTLKKLAEALSVNPADLIQDGDGDETPHPSISTV